MHTHGEATGQCQESGSVALHSACEWVCTCHSVCMEVRCQGVYMSQRMCGGQMSGCAYGTAYVWRSDVNLQEFVLSFHHVGPTGQTHSVRFGCEHLSLLSGPSSLRFKSGSVTEWSSLIFLDWGPASSSHLPVFSFSRTGDTRHTALCPT